MLMRNSIGAAMAAVLAALVVATAERPAAQARQRVTGEGLISEGIPKMPNPPGPAPNRALSGYEQQRVWREVWTDGRALPRAVDVKDAPESRFYGYSVGHWENDNTLVIDTTGLDDRTWLDEAGHPHTTMAHIPERY